MDFSKIKEWIIPEGKVISLSIGGTVVWAAQPVIYTVSGAWQFNETISIPTEYFTEDVTGIFIGYVFTECELNKYGIHFYAAEPIAPSPHYDIDKGWEYKTYRTIRFDGVQIVTQKFYKWLVANAKSVICGTYLFDPKEDFFLDGQQYDIEFISNGQTFTGIRGASPSVIYYGDTMVHTAEGWTDERYKTIKIVGTRYVGNDIYEAFEPHITQQTIAFTIDGTQYFANIGMTWGEWVASKYNTDGFTVDKVSASKGSILFPNTKSLWVGYAKQWMEAKENHLILEMEYVVTK